MSDVFWINLPAMLVALGGLLAGVIAALIPLIRVLHGLRDKVDAVEKATNGMKADLIKVTGEAEHAKGVIQGEENVKTRRAATDDYN
jgi:uncharacterized protein YoxC